MSRLTENDIKDVIGGLKTNDEKYRAQFGAGIREIAAFALDTAVKLPSLLCAVVPVTSGLGVIGGFCETVRAILEYCGAEAFVTDKTDVAGLWEAYEKGADIIFTADDNVCAAFGGCGVPGGIRSDNGYATGIGFAAALELMMKNSCPADGSEIIVLGAGPVGVSAVRFLVNKEKSVYIYDPDAEKASAAVTLIPGLKQEHTPDAYAKYNNILCAANTGGFITAAQVTKDTNISAPGVPLGVTKEAAETARVFHNPLELGIAVMLYDCAAQAAGANPPPYI